MRVAYISVVSFFFGVLALEVALFGFFFVFGNVKKIHMVYASLAGIGCGLFVASLLLGWT